MNYRDMIGKIQKAKDDYYNYGTSQLTDQEYDRLVAQAEKLGYIETVGAAPVDSIKKIKHEHPMLSLDKCHSIEEVQKFAGNHPIIGMWKADGLTCSATYIDGVLTRLETRGDGMIGNDIMFHANSIENLPKHIHKEGRYVIDGEVIILWSDFEKMSSEYSHPRNLAAGSLNQLDSSVSAKRHLKFYAWDVIDGGENLLSTNLGQAIKLGFDVVNFDLVFYNHIEDVIDHLKNSADLSRFPIDGIVFKFDDISFGKSLGKTEHHFNNGIAWKAPDQAYTTILRDVEWTPGKTGILAPVAVFDEVDLDGALTTRATLHNLSFIKDLELGIGDEIEVIRSNMVIPRVIGNNTRSNNLALPTHCPSCGSPLKIVESNDTEALKCTNDVNCQAQLLGLWKTFVSKKGFDIEGLSEATLEILLKKDYINNCFVTIFQINQYKDELYKLDGFGKRSIDKLLTAIRASTSGVDFVNFLTAFSIPGVGTGQSKILAAKFKTFPEFADACDNGYDFSSLSGIGPILNMNIHKWWFNNYIQMCDVAEVVEFASDEPAMNEPEIVDNKVASLTFVISGSVNHFKNRGELQSKLESLGAKVSGSVSSKTDYLINNDNTSRSSKNLKAQKLGIPIITEDQLLEMIGN